MERNEKLMVRLDADTVTLLQKLVDDGEYSSLSEAVATAVDRMIRSKFDREEILRVSKEANKSLTVNINSLLNVDDSAEMEKVIRKAVSEYVRSKMEPEE
jgi:hypothetical protein